MSVLVPFASRLKFLALLVERNRGFQQRAGIIRYLRNTLCPHLRSMFLKKDLDVRKLGLCELHHRLQLVTQGTLNPATITGDVVAFQKDPQYAVLGKASVETMLSRRVRQGNMLS